VVGRAGAAVVIAKGDESIRPRPEAAALAEQLRDASSRAGGCLVAVAMLDAAPKARTVRALHATGLTAVAVRHSETLPSVVAQLRPDLVLIDIEICRRAALNMLAEVANAGAPATIICGSLPDPATRAALLCAGADDCVLAPYLLDELVARVLAVLRRTQPDTRRSGGHEVMVAGSLCVDVDHHSVSIDGEPVGLSVLEFRLLTYLLRHRGIALHRERLLADVWGYTIGTPGTVTVHIRRLRSKIEADPSRPVWIETVRGFGYRFCGDEVLVSRRAG